MSGPREAGSQACFDRSGGHTTVVCRDMLACVSWSFICLSPTPATNPSRRQGRRHSLTHAPGKVEEDTVSSGSTETTRSKTYSSFVDVSLGDRAPLILPSKMAAPHDIEHHFLRKGRTKTKQIVRLSLVASLPRPQN